MHLPAEGPDGKHQKYNSIAQHPEQVFCGRRACKNCPAQQGAVEKGEGVGRCLKGAAHERHVKPGAGEPGGEIGQQRPAQSAGGLDAEQAAAEQTHSQKDQGGGESGQNGQQNFSAGLQPQKEGGQVAQAALGQRHGEQGQEVAKNVVERGQRRGKQPEQKGGLPILGDELSGKEGEKGEAEQGDARRQRGGLKQGNGHIVLDGAEQQQKNHGKAQPEEEIDGLPENLPGGSLGEKQCPCHCAVPPVTMRRKASSSRSVPV